MTNEGRTSDLLVLLRRRGWRSSSAAAVQSPFCQFYADGDALRRASPPASPLASADVRLLTDKMFRSRNSVEHLDLGPSAAAWLPETPVKPNDQKVIQFLQCDILRDGKIVHDETLWVQGGKIVDGASLFFAGVKPDFVVDFGNKKRRPLIVPGFIDVQINGYFGYDFAEDDKLAEGLDVVAKGLLKYGVTSFLPTVVSSLPQTYEKVLPIIDSKRGFKAGQAEIIGAHLEGPFIAPSKKGAHNVDYFRTAPNGFKDVVDCYGKYLDASSGGEVSTRDSVIKIITVAPELEGMLDAVRGMKKVWGDDIVISLGHTEADYVVAEKAVEAGVSMITHLFNAMHPFYHRNPGPMGVLGLPSLPNNTQKPFFGVIADGIHASASSIRVAYNSFPAGAFLVTDAMAGAGLEGDEFMLGSMQVVRKGPMEVVIKGTNTLAGRWGSLTPYFCSLNALNLCCFQKVSLPCPFAFQIWSSLLDVLWRTPSTLQPSRQPSLWASTARKGLLHLVRMRIWSSWMDLMTMTKVFLTCLGFTLLVRKCTLRDTYFPFWFPSPILSFCHPPCV
ncbi:hypothetical protein BC830DRAFT_600041 [Chytriomyces sp. MP71]|nr:hypothetical protein BC830DRAFT_600041 [Chytriomyces sp. MP71]